MDQKVASSECANPNGSANTCSNNILPTLDDYHDCVPKSPWATSEGIDWGFPAWQLGPRPSSPFGPAVPPFPDSCIAQRSWDRYHCWPLTSTSQPESGTSMFRCFPFRCQSWWIRHAGDHSRWVEKAPILGRGMYGSVSWSAPGIFNLERWLTLRVAR